MEVKSCAADAILRVFTACPQDIRTIVMDVRGYKQFAKGHVAGSFSVRVSSNGAALLVSAAGSGCGGRDCGAVCAASCLVGQQAVRRQGLAVHYNLHVGGLLALPGGPGSWGARSGAEHAQHVPTRTTLSHPLQPACLPACMPASLPAPLPAYLPACMPASLPAPLPACQHHLPASPPPRPPPHPPAPLPPCLPACLAPHRRPRTTPSMSIATRSGARAAGGASTSSSSARRG